MKLFLLVYDRKAGALLLRREYSGEGRTEALAERYAQERALADRDEIEVVLLGADSWEALESTHSRYFKTMDELMQAMVEDRAR